MDVINTAVMITFQFAMLTALVWFVGSIALRLFGWLWVFFGLAIALSGAASGDATPGTYALAAFNIFRHGMSLAKIVSMLFVCGMAYWLIQGNAIQFFGQMMQGLGKG